VTSVVTRPLIIYRALGDTEQVFIARAGLFL
jgi:hypothetical protein